MWIEREINDHHGHRGHHGHRHRHHHHHHHHPHPHPHHPDPEWIGLMYVTPNLPAACQIGHHHISGLVSGVVHRKKCHIFDGETINLHP